MDGQLDAYNRQDLETFLSYYAPDVVIEDGTGQVIIQGHAEMRQFYGTMFAGSPDLRTEVVTRIRVGNYVIDEEQLTGVVMEGYPSDVHAVVISRLNGQLIEHVRVLT
jgi:hypothetical protein